MSSFTKASVAAVAVTLGCVGSGNANSQQDLKKKQTQITASSSCLEKLATDVSKSRCELTHGEKKSETINYAGVARESFLSPRRPGTGVVSVQTPQVRTQK
jgi:hypothetical protein